MLPIVLFVMGGITLLLLTLLGLPLIASTKKISVVVSIAFYPIVLIFDFLIDDYLRYWMRAMRYIGYFYWDYCKALCSCEVKDETGNNSLVDHEGFK